MVRLDFPETANHVQGVPSACGLGTREEKPLLQGVRNCPEFVATFTLV